MCDASEGGSRAERLNGPPPASHQDEEQACSRCREARWPCEDEPPPYASLVGPEQQPRVAWSYVFPGYEGASAAGTSDRGLARPLVSIPLTSYGIFKIEPPRYAATAAGAAAREPQRYPTVTVEPGPVVKASSRTARKYGAILIAATVIVFLMALSLMVRFVTEKSLWRG